MHSDSYSNRKVAYFYNYQIGKFHYGKEHPMKPKRIAMAHNLIVNYGLYRSLDVYQMREASLNELRKFHDPEYIQYLSQFMSQQKINIIKEYQQCYSQYKKNEHEKDRENVQLTDFPEDILAEFDLFSKWYSNGEPQINPQFRVGDSPDCPTFPGLFTFCQLSTGASIDCAHTLITGESDLAINWSGGLHHAKKREASGFCYVNDIVICILELLRVYVRVLYVDIDVHHGDGVEEAFFLTNRVMTVSFHQYGDDFYPGTGNIDSIGEGIGRFYSINVPLKPGMDDDSYFQIFKTVMNRVLETFRPDAIVVQCGADSLSYDKLGGFNLSIKGHGYCLDHLKRYGVPMILLGGGGYTIQNVSRCWAYETGLCINQQIEQVIPSQDVYYELYQPDFKLHYTIKTQVENKNKPEDLNKIVAQISEYLKHIESAPGVAFHDVPQSFYPDNDRFEIEQEDNIDGQQEISLKQFEGDIRGNEDSLGIEIVVNPHSQKIHSKENL